MNTHKTSQYTVRGIPPSINKTLRNIAAEREMSLNAVLLEALEKEAGIGQTKEYHDLDFLIGSWIADSATDKALKEQRIVDPREWR